MIAAAVQWPERIMQRVDVTRHDAARPRAFWLIWIDPALRACVTKFKRLGADCFPAFVAFSSFRLRSRLLERLPSSRCNPSASEPRALRATGESPVRFSSILLLS